MIIIFSYQKEDVEKNVLYLLKEYDPSKYKDAVIADKPDVQNLKLSIGVEIVTCDPESFYCWGLYQNQYLLDVFNREKIKPIKYKQLKETWFPSGINQKDLIDLLEECEGVYLKKDNKLISLDDIEDFKSLEDNNDVYCKSGLNYHITLDNKLKVKHIFPQAYSIDLVFEKICKSIENKEKKFRKYKKFSENNLFIYTFSLDIGSYRDLDTLISSNPSCFDYIYLLNSFNEKERIYVIDTKKDNDKNVKLF